MWTSISTALYTPSTGSVTVSFTRTTGAGHFGANVLRYAGSTGIGASSKTKSTGAPAVDLSTTGANSAVVVAAVDWNALDGSTRSWRSLQNGAPIGDSGVSEQTYARDSQRYTVYGAFLNGVTPSMYSFGTSSPRSQKYSVAAVEVKGSGA
jgi:hypothetical protein